MARRRYNCSVPTCVNYYNILKEPCFRFPATKKVAEDWVQAVNNPNLNVKEANTYCFSKYVCHRHFATHQFTTPKKLRLNRGAIPTLFLTSCDNSENCLAGSEVHKCVSSVRNGSIDKFAEPTVLSKCELDEANVKEETNMGTYEEAGGQLLPNIISRGGSSHELNNVRVKQPLQKVQERAENPVQDDSQLVEDILRETSVAEHDISNGNQSDQQNVHRECMEVVGYNAGGGREPSEMSESSCSHGVADEYEHVKLMHSESYMIATDTWESLPDQVCRLCASTDEHPKQSIVGWLGMLNEVIPDLVAVDDGLPQHVCRPCSNKLYTCNKIKADFVEAYKKLQECFGFAKLPGIQFLHLPADVPGCQIFNEVTEEELVPEVDEQLVSEDKEQLEPAGDEDALVYDEQFMSENGEQLGSVNTSAGSCRAISRSHKELFYIREVDLNSMNDLSVNAEGIAISYIDRVAGLKDISPHDKSDPAFSTSSVRGMTVHKVETRNKKYRYVCGECEEMFTEKGSLAIHKLTHVKVLECDCCKKHFTSVTQLNEHRYLHTRELQFMCEVCGKCFRTMMKLNSHKYVHDPPKYVCQLCNKKFRRMFHLTQHKKVHCGDTKLMCEVCGKMIYTASSLKIHLRIHTGEKPFQCAVCGTRFISAGRLRNHRLTHADKNFRCDSCGKEYYFKYSLLQHLQCHNNPKHYRCPICFTQFSNPQNMKRHRRMYCKKPICIVCNQTFLSDEMVEEHQMKEHTDEEVAVVANSYSRRQRFKCPVCSQSLYGKGYVLKHMECHGDYTYKPFACEHCPKTFSSLSMLRTHRIWHNQHHLFRCATCGKGFKTKYSLKWHDLSVHKNEHPFQCPYCDRQFKRLSGLIVHKRKHTGERPFTCPICFQKFYTKNSMLKHTKKHSQSSANVAWREVVEVTIPVSEVVFPSKDLSCDIGVTEQMV